MDGCGGQGTAQEKEKDTHSPAPQLLYVVG
jgi:hypothetical protein